MSDARGGTKTKSAVIAREVKVPISIFGLLKELVSKISSALNANERNTVLETRVINAPADDEATGDMSPERVITTPLTNPEIMGMRKIF